MKFKIALVIAASISLAACKLDAPSAEANQERATDQLLADADARVGMPRVTNFTEKRLANMILELRDQPNLSTFSYITDMNGRAHCLGRSIGFGLPYTTQITNPQKSEWNSIDGGVTLPQAEPNGLYSSDSTDATWVLLVGKDGKPKPAYVESQVTVTLEPLSTAATPC